jgi:hypothetical protein
MEGLRLLEAACRDLYQAAVKADAREFLCRPHILLNLRATFKSDFTSAKVRMLYWGNCSKTARKSAIASASNSSRRRARHPACRMPIKLA